DLLRMFADGVGLTCDRAQLAEHADQQRRKVAEVCETVVGSLVELDVSPSLRFDLQPPGLTRASPTRELVNPRSSGPLSRLTAREREVLELMATGATNAELADRMT